MPTGTICGFASPDCCPTLLCGNFVASAGLSQDVLLRACAQHVGCLSQGRCQTLCGLPRVPCALGVSRSPSRFGHLLGHVGDRCRCPQLSLLTTSLTIASQPGTFALQQLILGLELCRPALNLRTDARDLAPRSFISLLERADPQLKQIVPVRF
jgi:hypothetical protein